MIDKELQDSHVCVHAVLRLWKREFCGQKTFQHGQHPRKCRWISATQHVQDTNALQVSEQTSKPWYLLNTQLHMHSDTCNVLIIDDCKQDMNSKPNRRQPSKRTALALAGSSWPLSPTMSQTTTNQMPTLKRGVKEAMRTCSSTERVRGGGYMCRLTGGGVQEGSQDGERKHVKELIRRVVFG